MSVAEILAAALALPEEERERLAVGLLDSLSQANGEGEAWAQEIERRVEAMENGDVELVSQDDARVRIHERLGASRR